MIDFYKFNFLSVLGKEAISMSCIEYQKEAIKKYEKYIDKVKELKKERDEKNNI